MFRGAFIGLMMAMVLSGCSTMHNAAQVGDGGASTWVYVQQSGFRDHGIYRCKDSGRKVICRRAKMVE
jgi:uncharacterized protein YceK